jgi:hypothetical protein
LVRFGIALRLRALASLLLALERRRIAFHPKAQAARLGLQRCDYSRDLRSAKWASMINFAVLVRFGSWLFSNSGRALALSATDVAVLGTSALYGRRN